MSVGVGDQGLIIGEGGLMLGCCCASAGETPCGPCESPGETCTNCGNDGVCVNITNIQERLDWIVNYPQGYWQSTEYANQTTCCCKVGDTAVNGRYAVLSVSHGQIIYRAQGRFWGRDGEGYRLVERTWHHIFGQQDTDHFEADAERCPPNAEYQSFGINSDSQFFWTDPIAGANARGWIHRGCGHQQYLVVYGTDDPQWRGSWAAGRVNLTSGTCNEDPCATGACCCNAGCFDNLTSAECSAMGGDWQGAGSECADDPCGVPCCTDAGCIEAASFEACVSAGGVPMPSGSCDEDCGVTCAGACCVETMEGTECHEVTKDECGILGGTWAGLFSKCHFSGICSGVGGACCDPCSGECSITTVYGCIAAGGEWHGEESTCDPHPCTAAGACCFADGSCAELTPSCCAMEGGTWQAGSCSPNPCTVEKGACCISVGESTSCTDDMTASECASAGGSWQGVDTTCSGVTCPLCTACCIPDGGGGYVCLEGLTSSDCANEGGTFTTAGACDGLAGCPSVIDCGIIIGNPDGASEALAASATKQPCKKCSSQGADGGITI